MQPNETLQTIDLIKYLLGIVGGLAVVLNSILVYFSKKIYELQQQDHELLIKVVQEHKIFHEGETKL